MAGTAAAALLRGRGLLLTLRLPLSNEKARRDLGWYPAFPTIQEGVAQTLRRAA